jgi:hypothetical protein
MERTMTVANKAQGTNKVAPKVAALIALCLVSIQRLQRVNGPTYEIDKVYEFTQDVAKILLKETDDQGKPVWKVYIPKVKSENGSDEDEVLDIASTFSTGAEANPSAVIEDGKIKVGSEEEMAELGLTGNANDTVTL